MTKRPETRRTPGAGPDTRPETAGAKRPYRPPVLTEYGHIGKLTRGGSGPRAEFQGHRRHWHCL